MALANGATLPPVLVIAEPGSPSKLWLADGYHRLFAHRVVGAVEIEAEVRRGTREDALRLSLAANATHGKKRTLGDFKRGHDIAVRNGLVEPDDSVGLMELLRCSIRTAKELTRDARKQVKADRDVEIVAAKDDGKSHREIAAEFDVSPQTVAATPGTDQARLHAGEARRARIRVASAVVQATEALRCIA
jgi:hypothetical protein